LLLQHGPTRLLAATQCRPAGRRCLQAGLAKDERALDGGRAAGKVPAAAAAAAARAASLSQPS